MLSYSYDLIINLSINASGHRNNVVNRLNATGKRYFKKQTELIGKLASNDTSNIVMIQYIHILNNKYISNGLKGSTKIKIDNHY